MATLRAYVLFVGVFCFVCIGLENSMKNQELIRIVIKEELVLMTRHRDEAIILNQFLYWTPKTITFKKFIEEEESNQDTADFGWIYKKAEDLKDELLMIDTNVKTVRKYLNSLVEKGYLLRRRNPFHKYDKTYQYRINLKQIVFELNSLGYEVADLEKFFKNKKAIKKSSLAKGDEDVRLLGTTEITKVQFEDDNLDVGGEISHFDKSKTTSAITDINSEIINQENITNIEIKEENCSTVDSIAFKQIKELYLNFSNKKILNDNDEQHITDLLVSDIEVGLIVELMKECYAQTLKRKDNKGIWSFNYFKKFIEKALKQQNDQTENNQIATLNESLDFIGDTLADF